MPYLEFSISFKFTFANKHNNYSSFYFEDKPRRYADLKQEVVNTIIRKCSHFKIAPPTKTTCLEATCVQKDKFKSLSNIS